MAREKKEPVIVMSFAFYVPGDYSFEKFEKKSLDYCLFDSPIEIWGTPENVIAGITVHNEIIREVAAGSDQVRFVDQNGLIPKNGLYFNDICHLTEKGCERFVDNLTGIILETMGVKNSAGRFTALYRNN